MYLTQHLYVSDYTTWYTENPWTSIAVHNPLKIRKFNWNNSSIWIFQLKGLLGWNYSYRHTDRHMRRKFIFCTFVFFAQCQKCTENNDRTQYCNAYSNPVFYSNAMCPFSSLKREVIKHTHHLMDKSNTFSSIQFAVTWCGWHGWQWPAPRTRRQPGTPQTSTSTTGASRWYLLHWPASVGCYSWYCQVDLGPYHAGIDPYHDLDLPRPGPGAQPEPGQCGGGGGRLLDMWVPYTAIIILFTVLIQV